MLSTFWRRLSKHRAFNKGERLTMEKFTRPVFKNDFPKLAQMFQLRNYVVNNTPYQSTSDKYSNDMANLQKELNSQQANIISKRVATVGALLLFYSLFLLEEEARDWKGQFDLKFNLKAYGSLDDSSGEGNVSIDD